MLIECPKCNEADERYFGLNRCGLCECEFLVSRNGAVDFPLPGRLKALKEILANGGVSGSDDGGNTRSSFG